MSSLHSFLAWTTILLSTGSCLAAGPFIVPHGPIEVVAIDHVRPEKVSGATDSQRENTRLMSTGLAVLLGPFGAHRLYLGTTPKVAVVYGITFGGFGALVLLDLGHLLFTKDLDPYRNNTHVFMWNARTGAVTPP